MFLLPLSAALVCGSVALAAGSGDHSHGTPAPDEMLEAMRDMRAGHDHAHDFEAMNGISEAEIPQKFGLLMPRGDGRMEGRTPQRAARISRAISSNSVPKGDPILIS